MLSIKRLFLVLLLVFAVVTVVAQDDPPAADVVNDDGGPIIISGTADYTFPNFGLFFENPYILVSDATSIILRDFDYDDRDVSQIFGKITSNPFRPPFTYQVSLPIEPLAELHDLDQDDETDLGVMVFYVGVTENFLGDPFAEPRDFMRGFLASVIISDDAATYNQIEGGSLLIYAPDDEQGFPSGFGDDSVLFTEDDPTVIVPQGYSVVNLDDEPFTFDRSEEADIALLEPELAAANDFSNLSYTDAFDEMVELFKTEYAFTEYREVDWDVLAEQYRPDVEAAEETGDPFALLAAVRGFTYSVPDRHLWTGSDNEAFQIATAGGLGLAIRKLDDGRTIVNFITPEGPAEEAGIELRAEILEINGTPIEEHVENTMTFAGPMATHDFEWLQKLRYSTRFPMEDEEVEVTYQNPGDDEPTTVVLPLSNENDSFAFSSFNADLTGLETPLPIEFELMETGHLLITMNSFSDDIGLTFELWERALIIANLAEAEGIIIDMRRNNGGSAYLADQLPAYFFDEVKELGYSAVYDDTIDDFFYDPDEPDKFVLPDEQFRYDGPVAVLVGPTCASACESFAYAMTLEDRAAIVGQYTTSGMGGSVEEIFLPDGVPARITTGRSLNPDGEIHIEGIGVPPTVRVPVNEETLFAEGDVIMEAAIEYLENLDAVPAAQAGTIGINQTVEGELIPGERVRYMLNVPEGDDLELDFIVEDATGQLDTVLRIYLEGENDPSLENDDDSDRRNTFNSGLRGIAVDAGLSLIIEVGGFNDAEEGEFTLTVRETGAEVEPEMTTPSGESADADSEALGSIVDRASADEDFEILVQAVVAANLADTLDGEGPFTVFAPSDDAFAAEMEALVAKGLFVDPETLLTSLLLYHVIEGEYLAEDLMALDGESIATMLDDALINISVADGTVTLNDSVTLVVTDIVVENGVIHIIDAVLLPPE